jgi:hypothetical protein
MIDIKRAEAEAVAWSIPLTDWMELNVRIHGRVDVFGDCDLDNFAEEDWRSEVADVMVAHELAPKANRFLQCSRYAYLYQCKGAAQHQLFSPIYCDLRFCPRCAPRQFARLFGKYEPILRTVSAKGLKGFRLRQITLTSANLGALTPEQIKSFNGAVKTTLNKLMRKVRGWGALWCDEVGFDNTNLHAHILFFGPYIDQQTLARVWNQVSGHQVVWITEARGGGSRALLYILKYVSKPPAVTLSEWVCSKSRSTRPAVSTPWAFFTGWPAVMLRPN